MELSLVFHGSRNVRRGDSLCPFLFTLVVDVLNRMVPRGKERCMVKGIGIVREHIIFHDDLYSVKKCSKHSSGMIYFWPQGQFV